MNARILSKGFIFLFSLFFIVACDQSDKELSDNGESTELTSKPVTIAILSHADFVPDRTGLVYRTKIGLPLVLAERMIEHLTNSKRFIPVERIALRRAILEQRFGQNITKTYLDQTLDKAIADMNDIDGDRIFGVQVTDIGSQSTYSGLQAEVAAQMKAEGQNKSSDGGFSKNKGNVGTKGTLPVYNDFLKDYLDLGTAVGADYLILGNLEKLSRTTEATMIPYSTEGRTQKKDITDARMNLRVIDTKSATVIGATSLRTQISETVFTGKRSETDEFSFYDHLGRLAAVKVLDVIYPARIVSEEPLVISRGSNDSTQINDVYIIEREGKSVSDDSGQVIARLKDNIGLVRVVTTQETVAIVKPVNGKGFLKGDLAKLDAEASKPQIIIADSAKVPLKGTTTTLNQRPRVAVVLIKSGSTETPTDNSAEKHTPIFTDTIISRLTQTKRFEMLDRQEVDQLLKEQTLHALREDRDLASAVGTLKEADYLVYGSLATFSIEEKQTQLPGSNRIFKKKIGYLESNMRIVDARNGQILESRKISVKHQLSDPGAKGSRIVAELADVFAEQVVLMLMNKLYPIRVAAVGNDRTIYINRGDDGGLYAGEILDAYRLGDPVIDPETGVQLGQEEIVLGQVRIDEVEDARSKGSTLEATKVVEGDLLKRAINYFGQRGSQQTNSSETVDRSGAIIADRGAPGQPAKPTGDKFTIVVGKLKLSSGSQVDSSSTIPRSIKQMTDDLIFKLTDTNRFNVLERQEIDQLLDEKGFDAIVSDGQIDDRIQELIGADYLIHGDIDIFNITTQTREVPYLDEVETRATAIAQGVFRIVDVHKGEVKAGDRVRVSFKVDNVNELEPVKARLQDEFSTKVVAQVLIRLFSIKVLGIAGDGIVYLNRGNDAGLQNGDIFDVMRPGEKLIDSDTGRSFGTAETKVASVEVIAVEDSRSRASVKSGAEVLAGDILRKQQRASPKPSQPEVFAPNW